MPPKERDIAGETVCGTRISSAARELVAVSAPSPASARWPNSAFHPAAADAPTLLAKHEREPPSLFGRGS